MNLTGQARDTGQRRSRSTGRPIRVLQVLTSACAGGLSTYVLNLISHVDASRFENHLVCTHFPGPHFSQMEPLVASAKCLRPAGQLEKLVQLRELMRELRPDVVHAHQEPIASVAACTAGVPLRIETIHLAQYWLQDGHPLWRWLARCATSRHIVYNQDEQELVALRSQPRKIQIVHPGLDLSAISSDQNRVPAQRVMEVRRQLAIPHGAFVVGTVGRLDEQKGFRYLLEAAPSILAQCSDARFLLIGDGALRDPLESLTRSLGLSDRVLFLGYQMKPWHFLGAMDVFVMPSLFESWGFTAVEAMAAGLPVICSDIPGPSYFVEHEHTGLLVRPRDPGMIAAAVLRLWSEADLRTRLAHAGQAYVQQHMSAQKMVQAYEQLYSTALRA